MKKFAITLVILIVYNCLQAQSLKKYDIGSSGCKAYFFCNPGEFNLTYSEDSSKVYTAECKADSLNWGIICVALKQPVSPGQDAEDLLTSYFDFLKTVYKISTAAGYGKGHSMKNNADVKGMIDYWTDQDGDEWKIKGWTDGKFIAVLYVYANGKLNETSEVNLFLDGFRFKGMQ
jgi:hypothetical protein